MRWVYGPSILPVARLLTWGKEGESRVSDWMAINCLLVWRPDPQPWVLEASVLWQVDLPLHLRDTAPPFGKRALLGRAQAANAREE